MTHPSSLDLEAFACGEPLRPALLEHVEECSACGAFVDGLRGLAAAGPSAAQADAAVAHAIETASSGQEADVVRLADRAAPPARADARRRLWMIATSVVTPLAAAAAILLLARSTTLPSPPTSSPRDPLSAGAQAPAPPDTIQMGRLPQPVAAAEPDTRFKGGMQIAVVRDRGGLQTRFSGPVVVKPGDRLRVEVALDREQAILGAVLSDDGNYLELMPEGVRGAGTYFSERSAKIDETPTRGTIVIGSPEAVARARATKQFDGVATLRVEWEPQP